MVKPARVEHSAGSQRGSSGLRYRSLQLSGEKEFEDLVDMRAYDGAGRSPYSSSCILRHVKNCSIWRGLVPVLAALALVSAGWVSRSGDPSAVAAATGQSAHECGHQLRAGRAYSAGEVRKLPQSARRRTLQPADLRRCEAMERSDPGSDTEPLYAAVAACTG